MILLTVLRQLDSQKVAVIKAFRRWLQEDEGKHTEEKKAIVASVLCNLFKENQYIDFYEVIKNIDKIDKEVRGQYSLYLENFSYGAFVKKLEENGEKFISRINDTLNKILSQVLALPIAALALKTWSDGTTPAYFALLAYGLICGLALISQALILDHLKSEVSKFEQDGKVAEALKKQWHDNKKHIDNLIKWQWGLACILEITILTCLLFALHKIIASFF
ncbi:hypothetical protein [Stenoxybacter acetivorans]|uniref:hypothetical protein n=1 Tax=Stenoxybacter acetivorans TaxID=422441 RepID=UPI0006909148|nr:hypothetical protein [Stenoxybacter acetivorans]